MLYEMSSVEFFKLIEQSIVNAFSSFVMTALLLIFIGVVIYLIIKYSVRLVRYLIRKHKLKREREKEIENENAVILVEKGEADVPAKTKIPKGVLKKFSEMEAEEDKTLEEKYQDDGTW